MTALMTETEAVNRILRAASLTPVSDINNTSDRRASMAKQLLDEVRVSILSEGHHINTEKDIEYAYDSNGEIHVGTDVLRADATNRFRYGVPNVTLRGTRLYNLTDKTYVFTENLNLDVIKLFEWSELTRALQNYITEEASMRFIQEVINDSTLLEMVRMKWANAKATFEQEDSMNSDRNILTGSHSMYDIVGRRRNPVRRY